MSEMMKLDVLLNSFDQKLKKISDFLGKNIHITVLALFAVSLLMRVLFTPFNYILRDDSYFYAAKGLEITRGNFDPMPTHSIGWPLFLSPFFYLFGSASIFVNMKYAMFISDVVGALSIFPLAYISTKLAGKKSVFLSLIMMAFSSTLISSSVDALSEPLFILLFLVSFCFIIRLKESPWNIIPASIFAALAYYVRPNGILILPIMLLSFLFWRKQIEGFRYRHIIFAIVVFFAVSIPFLYQRYEHFGSPFLYGENSKFFVDSYHMVWSYNIPSPSLIDYLKTHTLADYFNKFVVRGILGIGYDYVYYIIPPVLLLFFLYGAIVHLKDYKFVPIAVVFSIWILGFIPIYDVFSDSRHMSPTLPLIFVVSSLTIRELFEKRRYEYILTGLLITAFILHSLPAPVMYWQKYDNIQKQEVEWYEWAAKNIKGKIALLKGGDTLMQQLPDAIVGVGGNSLEPYAPQSNLSMIKPGYFQNLSAGMDWLKGMGATHLLVDNSLLKRRPYFNEIYDKELPSYLIKIYADTKKNVYMYNINWTEYDRLQN